MRGHKGGGSEGLPCDVGEEMVEVLKWHDRGK